MAHHVTSARGRCFTVKVVFAFDETLVVTDVVKSMSVLALKDLIELESGVPRHLQRLTYFDDLDMEDDKKLSFYHVVANSIIRLRWWPEWDRLIRAAYYGDLIGVMSCRIRERIMDSNGRVKRIIFNEGGYVALFIASHRGHLKVVSKLMCFDIDACHRMPSGRSPIHVAIYKRRVTCVNLLIGKSKGIKDEEEYHENCVRRNTFLNICNQLKRKGGWRLLVMQLQKRMERRDSTEQTSGRRIPLREFQKYDSAFSAYLKGSLGRLYLGTVLQIDPAVRRKPIPVPWK